MIPYKKVRKGLETPLLIKGVRKHHFNILIIAAIAGVLGNVGMIFSSLMAGTGSWALIILVLLGSLIAFITIWIWMIRKAKEPRYNFKKEVSTISNRDLLKYL